MHEEFLKLDNHEKIAIILPEICSKFAATNFRRDSLELTSNTKENNYFLDPSQSCYSYLYFQP